jgi:hypothetical protein
MKESRMMRNSLFEDLLKDQKKNQSENIKHWLARSNKQIVDEIAKLIR